MMDNFDHDANDEYCVCDACLGNAEQPKALSTIDSAKIRAFVKGPEAAPSEPEEAEDFLMEPFEEEEEEQPEISQDRPNGRKARLAGILSNISRAPSDQ